MHLCFVAFKICMKLFDSIPEYERNKGTLSLTHLIYDQPSRHETRVPICKK